VVSVFELVDCLGPRSVRGSCDRGAKGDVSP
jgi:hypothetical protein